jgi:hypothetical protein
MERREGIDAPDEQAMAAFAGRAAEGPVYMLNLLEFVADGGAERYAEWSHRPSTRRSSTFGASRWFAPS